MKQEITRERHLPVFEIGIPELESLEAKLRPHFPAEECKTSITVEFKNNKIHFDSIAELKAHQHLPDQITTFYLWMGSGDFRFRIYARDYFGSSGSISAESNDEVWCISILEIAYPTFYTNKKWSNVFSLFPLGYSIFFLTAFPVILQIFGKLPNSFKGSVFITWAITLTICFIAYVFHNAYNPKAILRLRPIESLVMRNYKGITLIIAFLALIVAIIGLIPKH